MDIQRQIPASFDRVQRNQYGYNAKQVDQFLQRARVSFEAPRRPSAPSRAPMSAPSPSIRSRAATPPPAWTPRWTASKTPSPGANATNWLPNAARKPGCARSAGWPASFAGRLHRPDGQRFRRPAKSKARSYNTTDVDDLCHELIGYLEEDQPLSVDNVRRAVFRPAVGRDGYEESQVDAFLERAVELMAAID